MELIDAHIQLGLAASALLVLRFFMSFLLVYNMSWSFKGFKQLLRGEAYPTSLYQTVVFMFSGAVLGYNGLTFFGRVVSVWSAPYSLGFQCMLLIGSIAAFIGRRVAAAVDFERFYWLFASGNLEVATRIAEMNQVDPAYTQGVLDAAEATLSINMAKEAINAGSN